MTKALTTIEQGATEIAFVPEDATGNRLSRLQDYANWLDRTGRDWTTPDLGEYQQHLLERDETRQVGTYRRDNGQHKTGDPIYRHYGPVAASSIATYTATVRGRYRELLSDNDARDALYARAGAALAAMGQPDTPTGRKTFVDETIARLANGVKPGRGDVKPITKQDRTDSDVGLRLTKDQADALLASPGLIPIDKLRDTAILAVFLCTGIREAELANLQVDDLRQTVNGELCVKIARGKGAKQRAVPWGAGEWALHYVDKWLQAAHISAGAVFRGFYKPRVDGSRRMRRERLSTRALQKIVGGYPVSIGGELVTAHPHDLRRTYARRCYDAGMDIMAIKANLGHKDHMTTLGYIGVSDVETRKPPSLYSPPHWSELGSVPVQGEILDQEDD